MTKRKTRKINSELRTDTFETALADLDNSIAELIRDTIADRRATLLPNPFKQIESLGALFGGPR